jgi:hypothetical protein
MTDRPPITAMALFFDDVRFEVTGKVILIGQYVGDLILPDGAAPVDRLAVLVHVRGPRDYMPVRLGVRIEVPGTPPVVRQFPSPAASDFSDTPLSPFSASTMQAVIQLRFPPLRAGDLVDVWVQSDGNEFPAGRLRISNHPADLSPASGVPSHAEAAAT